MTLHQNVQQRAVMHHRRSNLSAFQNRAIVDPLKVVKPTTTSTKPVDTTPTKVVAPVPSSSTAAIDKSTSTASSSSSTSSSVSTSSSSTTSSSSSVATSSTTPVLSTPSSSSTSVHVTPTSISRIVSPTTGSSATAAAASNSAVVSTTSGLGTGTLIGIIGGSILGVIVICMAVAFFLRRFRKNQRGVDAFNTSHFRRSAVLLDEKDQQPDFRPRPPTMIERRNGQPSAPSGGAKASANDFPPPPSMAYPYSDQVSASTAAPPSMYGAGPGESDHGHGQYGVANPQYGNLPPPPSQNSAYNPIPSAYGVPPPGAFGSHYEQAGYGAPPIPGTYAPGAYAPYGAPDPRYPHPQYRYQQQQQQGYPQHSDHQQHPAQYAGYGPRMDSLTTSNSSPSRVLAPSSSSSAGSSLTRQPTQSSGAPPAYMDDGEGTRWAARSDMKAEPVTLSHPMIDAETGSSFATTPVDGTAKQNGARPVSAYSAYLAYDQDDAYGGM